MSANSPTAVGDDLSFASQIIAAQRADTRELIVRAFTAASEYGYENTRPFMLIMWSGTQPASDFIDGIIDGEGVMGSLLTLQPGVIEASLVVCSMLDDDIPLARTLLRSLCFQLSSAEGSAVVHEQFGSVVTAKDLRDKQEEAEGIRDLLERCGFDLERKSPSASRAGSVSFAGQTESMVFNATDAARKVDVRSLTSRLATAVLAVIDGEW